MRRALYVLYVAFFGSCFGCASTHSDWKEVHTPSVDHTKACTSDRYEDQDCIEVLESKVDGYGGVGAFNRFEAPIPSVMFVQVPSVTPTDLLMGQVPVAHRLLVPVQGTPAVESAASAEEKKEVVKILDSQDKRLKQLEAKSTTEPKEEE
jgi:hypothetical protein